MRTALALANTDWMDEPEWVDPRDDSVTESEVSE